jgi:transposase
MNSTTIAVDLAKNVFEVAMENEQRRIVARHRLTRTQCARLLRTQAPAHIVMEACGTAHHWGRLARASGHHVTLLPPQHVRPFVRRQKTDRTDVTGILDARHSDGLKSVPVKTIAQQEVLGLHRIRTQWLETRTARINAVRGLLSEHGIVLASGAKRGVSDVVRVLEAADSPVPIRLRRILGAVVEEIRAIEDHLAAIDRELRAMAKDDVVMTRLITIPGIGLLTSTALVGSVGHIHGFHRARQFASWLGLTAREHSSGERRHLGAITKQGNTYLRSLVIHGARSALLAAGRTAVQKRSGLQEWALKLAERRGHNRATVGLANKLARIIWAVWSREVDYTSRRRVAA